MNKRQKDFIASPWQDLPSARHARLKGMVPALRPEAPFLRGKYSKISSKILLRPSKTSAIPGSRWRCRKDRPFLCILVYLFWPSKRKYEMSDRDRDRKTSKMFSRSAASIKHRAGHNLDLNSRVNPAVWFFSLMKRTKNQGCLQILRFSLKSPAGSNPKLAATTHGATPKT